MAKMKSYRKVLYAIVGSQLIVWRSYWDMGGELKWRNSEQRVDKSDSEIKVRALVRKGERIMEFIITGKISLS